MRHPVLAIMPPSWSSSPSSSAAATPSSTSSKPKSSNPNPSSSSSLPCKHSPSATVDLLILILVLFSGSFLLTSYFSYIFNSLSLLLSSTSFHVHLHLQFLSLPYLLGFVSLFAVGVLSAEFCFGARSRKCDRPGCKGLKKAMEFDLKLQNEESVRNASKEIDRLPWKGRSEANPDYECLRTELRKMAPPNGRAVLLFRARCGCPIAKLEGWGPKRRRRHKKALAATTLNGGDHR